MGANGGVATPQGTSFVLGGRSQLKDEISRVGSFLQEERIGDTKMQLTWSILGRKYLMR